MDRNVYYYQYYTPHGAVSLIPEANGRYKVMFGDENLGSYHSPEAAAGDVSGGHTFAPSNGVDLCELDISDDLGEWEKKVFMTVSRLRPA
jgi:hypothetical protein